MSLLNRNDRSIHTDHKRVKSNLSRHADLMAKYQAQGMSRDDASKRALKVIQGKITECVVGSRSACVVEIEQ